MLKQNVESKTEKVVRLSDAQISAIECRDLDAVDAEILGRAFRGDRLVFELADAEPLYDELTDASNAEDAYAEHGGDDPELKKFARKAARSLSAVAGRVLKIAYERS